MPKAATTTRTVRDPQWVREALYYADRPSRRLSGHDIESEIANLQLAANGGRVVTTADGWDY